MEGRLDVGVGEGDGDGCVSCSGVWDEGKL